MREGNSSFNVSITAHNEGLTRAQQEELAEKTSKALMGAVEDALCINN